MSDAPQMNRSRRGRMVSSVYGRVPLSGALLRIAVAAEGGQFTSMTLRSVLEKHYGVRAGAYSYGSLLTPGYADRGTEIGRYVSIGPGVRRFGASHPMDRASMHPYWYNPRIGFADEHDDVERTEIWIGHDSWIGANSVILPKVRRVGIGAVIGAGAIVTRDVDDFSIVVGNPAREVGKRLSVEQRERVLVVRPWELEPLEAIRELRKIDALLGSRGAHRGLDEED